MCKLFIKLTPGLHSSSLDNFHEDPQEEVRMQPGNYPSG
jgi:hypothetical protein